MDASVTGRHSLLPPCDTARWPDERGWRLSQGEEESAGDDRGALTAIVGKYRNA